MTKKVFALVTAIIGGCASIASAVITFCNPSYAGAIVAGIGIASTAAVEICNLFVKQETE